MPSSTWLTSQTGRSLVVRETFTDGRKTLRIRFVYDWQTDYESSVSQMAQVNVLACGTDLKWGGKVKVEDKKKPEINLKYDWLGMLGHDEGFHYVSAWRPASGFRRIVEALE